MKNYLFAVLLLSLSINLNAQTDTITVKNVNQFLKAIKSNRVLFVEANTINFSDADQETKKIYLRSYDALTDSLGNLIVEYKLTIEDVNNLAIIGVNDEKSKIVTSYPYADVISFNNCRNIRLENIEVGHVLVPGKECGGEVLDIRESSNFKIENCRLFGCGTIGIYSWLLDSLYCENVLIDSCSTGQCLSLSGNAMVFKNCILHNNQYRYDIEDGLFKHYKSIISVSHKNNVLFDNCSISDNATFKKDDVELFSVYEGSRVILKNCLIKNNDVGIITNNPDYMEIINCKFIDNRFNR